ncbi:MAG: type II secretion system major pseudopilin GspG [Syntrophaceae bacterium]
MDNKGFTLMELLVVVIILGILATYVGVKLVREPERARINQTKIQIQALEQALKMYQMDNGEYPSTEQGLKALVEKPSTGSIPRSWKEGGYLEKNKVPKDAWGNEYVYMNPGLHNPNGVDVFSYGPDGQPGGDGDNADIGNWESEAQ